MTAKHEPRYSNDARTANRERKTRKYEPQSANRELRTKNAKVLLGGHGSKVPRGVKYIWEAHSGLETRLVYTGGVCGA